MKKTRINPKVFAKSNAYAAGQRTVRAVGIQQHNAQGMSRKQGRTASPAKVRRR